MKKNLPVAVVMWVAAAMVLVSGGKAWGWPSWVIVLFGGALLGTAYAFTRHTWKQLREQQEHIQTALHHLKQTAGLQDKSSPSSRAGQSHIDEVSFHQTIAQIQSRFANLEEERAKIATVVENLVEGVLAFDPKGKVLFSNPSARKILGLEELKLIGSTIWEIIRNPELGKLVEACQELAYHQSLRAEIELHTPTSMVLEIYALPVPFSNRKKGSVLVLHDVTTLRRLEQVRAEFVENVSHELRTPLAAIVGYLETLIDEPSLETPGNRKFLQVAHHHAERLTRLVNDIRILSEIESRKVVLNGTTVKLREVVEEVCAMFQSQVSRKDLNIGNEVKEEAVAWVDRDRLNQILVNLVDNAIKYTPSGGTISFLAFSSGRNRVLLQVRDTGQGIPSIDLPRITERFYRVDRARSREEGGTGLGLSIVKHLMQLLGGTLNIKSEIGKGTTVEMELPVSSGKLSL